MLQIGAGGTSGSISGDVLNNATLAFNRSDVLTVSGLIAGSGSVSQIGPGTTILTGDNSYSGATNVRAGTLRINGDQSLATGLTTVASGARLGGSGTIGGDVAVNAGAIVAPGNSIGTLTVTGDYTGSGGTVDVETELGDDASATDRLVIGGDTSGASNVRVTNVGGGGGQTIEGIKIIDVAGASNGSFSLIGDYLFEDEQAVVSGAYAYRLYQNGISTPADGDWYLRSELIEAPGDPDPTPLYAPGVPIYEAYAGALQSFNELGTLRQRTGGRPPANDQDATGSDGGSGQPIQTRIKAAHGHFEPGTSTTGTAYDVETWKLEAGLDGLLHEGDAGLLIGGISLHYGTVSAEVSSVFGDGDIDATGYGFGASLTWYGNSGFYVDTQGALTWYDTNLHSSTLGATLVNGNDGFGYALGIEAGQTIDLSGNWSLIPQAQLAYSSVRFDDFTDPYGAAVSLGDGDTLIGRLGISANYAEEWKDEAGKLSTSSVYSIANLYYDFLDGSEVDISGTPVIGENRSLWGGLGIGGSYSWSNGRYSVHGEAFARTSLQDFGDSNSFGGKIGFSVKW